VQYTWVFSFAHAAGALAWGEWDRRLPHVVPACVLQAPYATCPAQFNSPQLCPTCLPMGHEASLVEDVALARYAYCLRPLLTYLEQPGAALPPAGFSLLHICRVLVTPCTAEACNGGIFYRPE